MTVYELLSAWVRALPPDLPPDERPDLPAHTAALDIACSRVTHDSRQASPGSVFVALRGFKSDGVDFAPQAIAAGAAVVVAERAPDSPSSVPWVVVADARLALAQLAAEFFGHPSREMQVVGITGTNGKTTTGYLVSAIFEAAGITCGLMGTVTYRVGAHEFAATRTTPEAPEVQGLMRFGASTASRSRRPSLRT